MQSTRATGASNRPGKNKAEKHAASAARQPERAASVASAASAVAQSAETATPAQVLVLQRAIGNTAVGRLVGVQRAEDPQAVLTSKYWRNRAGAGAKSDESAAENMRIEASAKARASGTWAQGTKREITHILGEVGHQLLTELAKPAAASAGQLKLYRAMSRDEADGILAYFGSDRPQRTEQWIHDNAAGSMAGRHYKSEVGAVSIGKHLGDRDQAEKYQREKGGSSHAVLLEFTLKPGAHEILFGPEYAALGPSTKTEYIRAAHKNQGTHENAHGAEGTLAGYIGVKAEQKGPFSLSLAGQKPKKPGSGAGGPSQLLFQLLVQSVAEVPRSA